MGCGSSVLVKPQKKCAASGPLSRPLAPVAPSQVTTVPSPLLPLPPPEVSPMSIDPKKTDDITVLVNVVIREPATFATPLIVAPPLEPPCPMGVSQEVFRTLLRRAPEFGNPPPTDIAAALLACQNHAGNAVDFIKMAAVRGNVTNLEVNLHPPLAEDINAAPKIMMPFGYTVNGNASTAHMRRVDEGAALQAFAAKNAEEDVLGKKMARHKEVLSKKVAEEAAAKQTHEVENARLARIQARLNDQAVAKNLVVDKNVHKAEITRVAVLEFEDMAQSKAEDRVRKDSLEQARDAALEQARSSKSIEVIRIPERNAASVDQVSRALEQTGVTALEQARVAALEQARVDALEQAHVVALQQTRVVALEQAHVVALEQTRFDALEQARVAAHEMVQLKAAAHADASTRECLEAAAMTPEDQLSQLTVNGDIAEVCGVGLAKVGLM